MHALISYAMVVLLGIHALLGCCSHHAHGQVAAATDHASSSCCHDGDNHDDHSVPSCPSKSSGECAGVCTYLPPQRTLVDSLDWSAPLPVTIELAVWRGFAADCRTAFQDSAGLRYGPSLRIHLLNQSLLI